MKIKFHTNIDKYKGYHNLWPTIPDGIVPRKGETVQVRDEFVSHFATNNLPTLLEVVKVTYKESHIAVELHYSEIDIKLRETSVLFGF